MTSNPLPRPATATRLALTTITAVVSLSNLTAQTPPTLPRPDVLPIHALDTDPTRPYGTWGAGRDYKASFDDGLTFHPYVGPDRASRPVRWETSALHLGRLPILGRLVPSIRSTPTRHEIDYVHVVERYDLRTDGIEQSWIIPRRLLAGDVVIRGSVHSSLSLPIRAATFGAIDMTAADGVAVRYGAVTAVDANGARRPIDVSSNGSEISMIVPDDWLSTATYPIVIDPLISNRSTGARDVVTDVDVLHETVSSSTAGRRTWLAVSTAVAAGDRDVVLLRTDDTLSITPVAVYADLATDDARNGRLALANGSPPYAMLAYAVTLPSSGAGRVYWHRHGVHDATLQTNASYRAAANWSYWRPDVGGSDSTQVLLVCQREAVQPLRNTDTSVVVANVIDLANGPNGSLGTTRFPHPDPNADQERPSVNRHTTTPTPAWVVAFQQLRDDVVNDDWDVTLTEVDTTGVRGTPLTTDDAGQLGRHETAPIVDGDRGAYCVLYARSGFELTNPRPASGAGEQLRSQRVTWNHGSHVGSLPHASTTLVDRPTRSLLPAGLGFDPTTRSHWCTTHENTAANTLVATKLGYAGREVESLVLMQRPGTVVARGGVAFDAVADEFVVGFGSDDSTAGISRLHVARVGYANAPPPTTFGLACGSGIMQTPPGHAQRIGSRGISIVLDGSPQDGQAFLLMSRRRGRLPLGPVGMPGCDLLVDPAPAAFAATVTASVRFGHAAVEFPLPEDLRPFTLSFQWIYPATGANALGLQASQGLEMNFAR